MFGACLGYEHDSCSVHACAMNTTCVRYMPGLGTRLKYHISIAETDQNFSLSPREYNITTSSMELCIRNGVHVPLFATAFIDIATSFIYSFLLIHFLIYSFVSIICLFIYGLPTTFSVAQTFTMPSSIMSVQSISISVQNFRPTQLFSIVTQLLDSAQIQDHHQTVK